MIRQLQDKKVLFFDVGYTLDMPASGDWMFTGLFLREAGEKLKEHTGEEISRARDAGLRFLKCFFKKANLLSVKYKVLAIHYNVRITIFFRKNKVFSIVREVLTFNKFYSLCCFTVRLKLMSRLSNYSVSIFYTIFDTV